MYSSFLCDVKLCKKSAIELENIVSQYTRKNVSLFKNNSHNNGHLNYVIIDRSLFNLNNFLNERVWDVIEISISIKFLYEN